MPYYRADILLFSILVHVQIAVQAGMVLSFIHKLDYLDKSVSIQMSVYMHIQITDNGLKQ